MPTKTVVLQLPEAEMQAFLDYGCLPAMMTTKTVTEPSGCSKRSLFDHEPYPLSTAIYVHLLLALVKTTAMVHFTKRRGRRYWERLFFTPIIAVLGICWVAAVLGAYIPFIAIFTFCVKVREVIVSVPCSLEHLEEWLVRLALGARAEILGACERQWTGLLVLGFSVLVMLAVKRFGGRPSTGTEDPHRVRKEKLEMQLEAELKGKAVADAEKEDVKRQEIEKV